MRKPKKKQNNPQVIKSLEELIREYDRATLINALNSFKSNNVGWQTFKSALMKEYIMQAGSVMDLAQKTGSQIEAAYHAGVAQTLYDVATVIIDKYINYLEEGVKVTQSPRPEE